MLRKTIVALFASFAAAPVFAGAASIACEPPVIQTPSNPESTISQYLVQCAGADKNVLAPEVRFAGEIDAKGTAPYLVKATYIIDGRPLYMKRVEQHPRVGQIATGKLMMGTDSLASLPAKLSSQVVWDSGSGVLSIEERPGQWRAFSLNPLKQDGYVIDAGVASTPVKEGRAKATVYFGHDYSRFADKKSHRTIVNAHLGLRDGKFELLVGESREATEELLKDALSKLDSKPKDITRAWAFASRAKFLGLEDEVRYAEQKVAAHHPHLLQEFQASLTRIEPFVLPNR